MQTWQKRVANYLVFFLIFARFARGRSSETSGSPSNVLEVFLWFLSKNIKTL